LFSLEIFPFALILSGHVVQPTSTSRQKAPICRQRSCPFVGLLALMGRQMFQIIFIFIFFLQIKYEIKNKYTFFYKIKKIIINVF
jgi:hypothetical protein